MLALIVLELCKQSMSASSPVCVWADFPLLIERDCGRGKGGGRGEQGRREGGGAGRRGRAGEDRRRSKRKGEAGEREGERREEEGLERIEGGAEGGKVSRGRAGGERGRGATREGLR